MSRPGAVVIVAVFAVGAIAASASRARAEGDDAESGDGGDGDEPKLIGDPSPPPPDSGDHGSPATSVIKDHYHQFGLALQIPVGVRLVAPYDGEYCGARGENGNANAEVCVAREPATLDFELAYGVKRNVEVLLEMRVGVERDFGMTANSGGGPRIFQWSPGVKFYFSQAKTSKLFSTAQIAFDHTNYGGQPGTDFFLRNLNGLQLDLDQSYGVYFFIGEELAFRRWISAAVELGVGFQGRYP